MAFGRMAQRGQGAPMADINMTPLIDVMLVLLVIFMITAPLMTAHLKLDLPKADGMAPAGPASTLAVALSADGAMYLDERRIDPTALAAALRQAAARDPQTEVQLRSDQAVPYGRVAELISALHTAGLHRIAFVTEPGGTTAASR